MRKFICAVICMGFLLCLPKEALAMSMDFDLRFGKEEDLWIGEIWYDHALWWQLAFAPGGAVPVSTGRAKYHTVVTPDFTQGFFLFRIR